MDMIGFVLGVCLVIFKRAHCEYILHCHIHIPRENSSQNNCRKLYQCFGQFISRGNLIVAKQVSLKLTVRCCLRTSLK